MTQLPLPRLMLFDRHVDQPLPDDFANPNYRTVKVFVGIFDLPPNGGATAVVPGTHRIPFGPGQLFSRGNFRSSGQSSNGPEALHQTLMPNYVEAALPAGCGIAFDVRLAPFTWRQQSIG